MASVKEMRTRIGSVKSTQKITKALNMVAAAKLKRAQDQAMAARPYARKMAAVIANLAAGVSGDGAPKLLAGTGKAMTDVGRAVVQAVPGSSIDRKAVDGRSRPAPGPPFGGSNGRP